MLPRYLYLALMVLKTFNSISYTNCYERTVLLFYHCAPALTALLSESCENAAAALGIGEILAFNRLVK